MSFEPRELSSDAGRIGVLAHILAASSGSVQLAWGARGRVWSKSDLTPTHRASDPSFTTLKQPEFRESDAPGRDSVSQRAVSDPCRLQTRPRTRAGSIWPPPNGVWPLSPSQLRPYHEEAHLSPTPSRKRTPPFDEVSCCAGPTHAH